MNVCGRELLAHVTHLYIQHDNLRALTIKTFCERFVFGFDYSQKRSHFASERACRSTDSSRRDRYCVKKAPQFSRQVGPENKNRPVACMIIIHQQNRYIVVNGFFSNTTTSCVKLTTTVINGFFRNKLSTSNRENKLLVKTNIFSK